MKRRSTRTTHEAPLQTIPFLIGEQANRIASSASLGKLSAPCPPIYVLHVARFRRVSTVLQGILVLAFRCGLVLFQEFLGGTLVSSTTGEVVKAV